ncbi:DNA-binding protein [Paenarthrobacter sp. PH39-S1]|uniref:DNA-binding protein n=1 Tax=Paenarthrobacter sp. PH39-S1 TaxID=3046204 RepID=UPI0024B8AF0A|nr:DNA-binding protein [Paenarthrobacter sp. PH39-S1]MDJ0358397.1 DNA-binding protein [Paenarthrobacter sp. PH39-S1]
MAEQSVKDRVYAAAERISATTNPTVATVREAASVSNADAGRYLKEWRAERDSAGSKIAATPPIITEQALRSPARSGRRPSAPPRPSTPSSKKHGGKPSMWRPRSLCAAPRLAVIGETATKHCRRRPAAGNLWGMTHTA